MNLIKKGIKFLQDQEIDIRLRLLFLMEYATLLACLIEIFFVSFIATNPIVLIPNIIMTVTCCVGIYLSQVRKKYDLAVNVIIIGCAYLTLPFMFFTAGGIMSGMPLWFVFGVIFSCMMSKGKGKIVMPVIAIGIFIVCMIIARSYPGLVIALKNDDAVFADLIQSFGIVCLLICICLEVYLNTYDKQRSMLELQRHELQRILNMDALTGIANRRAYYEEANTYIQSGYTKDIVLVALDVNGLKNINDTLGHSAGDNLIKTAANIINNAYSKYGNIYRTGGDEFVAILKCSDSEARGLNGLLEQATNDSNEEFSEGIAIAMGVVLWNDNSELPFSEIEKLADSRMYENKSEFYRNSGLDRRKS